MSTIFSSRQEYSLLKKEVVDILWSDDFFGPMERARVREDIYRILLDARERNVQYSLNPLYVVSRLTGNESQDHVVYTQNQHRRFFDRVERTLLYLVSLGVATENTTAGYRAFDLV